MTDISVKNQLGLSNLELTSQLMQGTYASVSKINKSDNLASIKVQNKNGSQAYAVKGDLKYKKEFDTDNNGIVTYNEYIKYVSDSISSKSKLNTSSVSFSSEEDYTSWQSPHAAITMKKALWSYLNSSINLPSGLIDKKI